MSTEPHFEACDHDGMHPLNCDNVPCRAAAREGSAAVGGSTQTGPAPEDCGAREPSYVQEAGKADQLASVSQEQQPGSDTGSSEEASPSFVEQARGASVTNHTPAIQQPQLHDSTRGPWTPGPWVAAPLRSVRQDRMVRMSPEHRHVRYRAQRSESPAAYPARGDCRRERRGRARARADGGRAMSSDVNLAGQAWQMVTCKQCKAHYQCTPWADYYSATTLDDGLCEPCLITNAGLDPAKTVTVVEAER